MEYLIRLGNGNNEPSNSHCKKNTIEIIVRFILNTPSNLI